MRLTPWQRVYMRAVTPTHPEHGAACRTVFAWARSKYVAVQGALHRMGAIDDTHRPTARGAEALAEYDRYRAAK